MKHKRRTTNLLAIAVLLLTALLLLPMSQATNVFPATEIGAGDVQGLTVYECAPRDSNPYYEYPGECTWYAWEKAKDAGYKLPSWGHAHNWDDAADYCGYDVGDEPKAGSVVVYNPSVPNCDCPLGHVGWVADVEGNQFRIQDMNWGDGGERDEWVDAVPGLQFIYLSNQCSDLIISPSNPQVDETVTFCFDVCNYSGQSITFQNVGPQGHGPPNGQGGP